LILHIKATRVKLVWDRFHLANFTEFW